MTLFKNNCLIACLAYLLTIIGFLALTAGFFTPFWNVSTQSDGTTKYSGLLMTCYSSFTCSFDVEQIKKYTSGDFSGFQIGAMTLGIAGWVLGLVALIIIMVYSCFPITVTGVLAFIFALLSGVSGAACVIIYGSGIPNLTQVSVSWSLGLFTGGSALMIAVGILLIINVCVL
ncbi:hypothetical protein CHS0354_014011 [Potamilus streckersoni]|uniref:Uncharacterized protein n=1 Tax=Potamilus streckersoni TaxID=2493646 RepID=A0AAE0TKJ3_9BIVA|nr:hypothetical protein CHS0354_014011 [Potamilus streckersoni]